MKGLPPLEALKEGWAARWTNVNHIEQSAARAVCLARYGESSHVSACGRGCGNSPLRGPRRDVLVAREPGHSEDSGGRESQGPR